MMNIINKKQSVNDLDSNYYDDHPLTRSFRKMKTKKKSSSQSQSRPSKKRTIVDKFQQKTKFKTKLRQKRTTRKANKPLKALKAKKSICVTSYNLNTRDFICELVPKSKKLITQINSANNLQRNKTIIFEPNKEAQHITTTTNHHRTKQYLYPLNIAKDRLQRAAVSKKPLTWKREYTHGRGDKWWLFCRIYPKGTDPMGSNKYVICGGVLIEDVDGKVKMGDNMINTLLFHKSDCIQFQTGFISCYHEEKYDELPEAVAFLYIVKEIRRKYSRKLIEGGWTTDLRFAVDEKIDDDAGLYQQRII